MKKYVEASPNKSKTSKTPLMKTGREKVLFYFWGLNISL